MTDLNNLLPETDWKKHIDLPNAKLVLFNILRNKTPTPSRESGRMFNALHNNYCPQYPKRANSDLKKFAHLKQMFMKNQIQQDMFVEFAEVLDFTIKEDGEELSFNEVIAMVINQKIVRSMKW